jgi:hypothetical protein
LSYGSVWLLAVAVLNVLAGAGVFCAMVCRHSHANKEEMMSQ